MEEHVDALALVLGDVLVVKLRQGGDAEDNGRAVHLLARQGVVGEGEVKKRREGGNTLDVSDVGDAI